jgi:hypothetical protein
MVRRSREEWVVLVDDLARSGLTAKQFAHQRGINANTLLWWRVELRRRARSANQPAFIEVVVTERAEDRPAAPFVVVLRDVRHEVVVPNGFDAAELRRLVDALC